MPPDITGVAGVVGEGVGEGVGLLNNEGMANVVLAETPGVAIPLAVYKGVIVSVYVSPGIKPVSPRECVPVGRSGTFEPTPC